MVPCCVYRSVFSRNIKNAQKLKFKERDSRLHSRLQVPVRYHAEFHATSLRIYIYIYIYIYICTYIHNICIYVLTYLYTYMYTLCVCVCVYIHTHIHTCIHIHIYAYTAEGSCRVCSYLSLCNVPCKIGDRMRNIVVRHSKHRNLSNRTISALHTTGPLVDGGKICVHITGVTTPARNLLTGGGHLTESVGV